MKRKFFVHKTAYVEKGAQIGNNTKIWYFSHIMRGVKIGKDCRIGQNVVLHPQVKIGNNVKIQNNVSIYDGTTLEDNVFCGPSVVFTNVSKPRAEFPRDPLSEYENTLVKDGATLGANSTIICGHILGRYCFVGAGSVVTKDIPDYALVYGNPAVICGWVCKCAQRLIFNSKRKEATCVNCGRIYKKKLNDVKEIKR